MHHEKITTSSTPSAQLHRSESRPAPQSPVGRPLSGVSFSQIPIYPAAQRATETQQESDAAPTQTSSHGVMRESEGSEEFGDVSDTVGDGLAGGGQPLDSESRSFLEPRFGHDFSNVRIHTDSRASQSAQSIAAKAYTVGTDIAFRSGEYQPGSSDGKRLLAHEITHVIQQGGAQPSGGGGDNS